MGNTGSNWSPAYMDDMDSTHSSLHDQRSRTRTPNSEKRDSTRNRTPSNIEIIQEDNSDMQSLIGSVVSSLASNTVLQPNFGRDKSIITAMHNHSPNNDAVLKITSDIDNASATQSEFEYLQSLFPHLHKTEDVNALRDGPHSALSSDIVSAQYYQNINANHPQLITTPINITHGHNYITPPQKDTDHRQNDRLSVKIECETAPDLMLEHPHELQQPLISTDKKKTKSGKKKKKKRKKKKKKEVEYHALGSPPAISHSQPISFRSYGHKSTHDNGCVCECLTMLFYTLISILSVCLIFGSLLVDICMARYVYYFPKDTFEAVYFIPCVAAIALTLISYTLNSCCFFIHTDYCGCMGPFAPFCRCLLSLPPLGVIYTLMLIPGVHSLPFHMASALCQYVLNLAFMMTNEIQFLNWLQLGVGSLHLIISPMFAWIQQSNQGNLTVIRCLKLMCLWLCSISPLTILELINIFPVFIEKFTYNNLDIRTFITLICWSVLIRLIFAFIFVDEDGSRLSLICFKPLRDYEEEPKKKKKRKKHKRNKKPICYSCIYLLRVIGQLILQLFYLALPLLPTAAATVRLYKKQCVEYAKWNHLCVAVYLVFTYLPMLYLLLGNDPPGEYTWITIAIAYGCTIWVVLFLPIYLKKWVTFRW